MTRERDGISIIIACRDMGDTLKRAVDSCDSADEIIIVNDASKDNTAAVILSLLNDAKDIRSIRFHKPAGVVTARNTAIGVAHYKLILPLDSDDYFLPGGIKALREAYEVGYLVYSGWNESGKLKDGSPWISRVLPPPIGAIKRKNVAQATWLFAKSDWVRVGGYPKKYERGAEDIAFMLALLQDGVKAKRIEDITYCYTPNPKGRAAYTAAHWDEIQAQLRADYPAVYSGA